MTNDTKQHDLAEAEDSDIPVTKVARRSAKAAGNAISINGRAIAPGTATALDLPVAHLYTHTPVSLPVHVLLYEAGEPLRFDELSIRAGVSGVVSVMRALGMLSPSRRRTRPREPFVARSSAWERADLRKGEALIASGNIAVQTNRQAYQAISQIPQGAESADAVADRASRFKKIAKAWEAGEEKIADGNDLVKRGNERIAEGEAEIAGGQRVIERGREKMQGAESRYTPAGS